MERVMTHRQIQELLGAYALDAVDTDEAEAVEEHLADCPRCREEVASHREAAAMLAHVGSPAPEGVWDRIAEQLGEPIEGGAVSGVGRQGGDVIGAIGPGGAGGAGGAVSDADARRAAERITDLADARARFGSRAGGRGGGSGGRSLPVRLMSAGLAVAAVIAAVLGVQLVRVNDRLGRVETLAAQGGVENAALAAAATSDARRVRLTSDDGARFADAVLLPNGQAYLIGRGLPALPDDETYQLWAVIGDQKISVGVLGNKPTVTAFHYDADPSLLAITAERAGGVVASEKRAVAVGAVQPEST